MSDFLSTETRGAEEKVRRLGNRDEEWVFRFNRTRRKGGLEMVDGLVGLEEKGFGDGGWFNRTRRKGGLEMVEVEGELSLKWTL